MKKKVLSAILVAAMALSLAACGGSGSSAPAPAPAEEKKEEAAPAEEKAEEAAPAEEAAAEASDVDPAAITIAYVPTTMNNPFWSAMMGGITAEMEAKGITNELVTVDANSDQATMNNYVYDLINQNVDAIILAPMDCTAVTEALQACADAGIPVVNVDTAVDRTDLVASVIASDNYAAGVQCAEDMMAKLPEGSKVYVMNQPSGTACVQREQGFKDTVGEYFDIVGTTDTSGDTAKTLPVAEDALTSTPDLGAFFCINDMGALACVQACAAAGKTDVLIYGVDGNPDFMGYVADGSATASAAQQPSVIGSSAVDTVLDVLAGKTVEADQVIGVELITGENISNFDITGWQ